MLIPAVIYCQFFFWTVLYTVLMIPAFAGIMIFAGKRRSAAIRYLILWYGKIVVNIALQPWVRIRYENTAGEPMRGGIYVFNHRSASDPFLVAAVTDIPVVQIVNDWPMRLPFFGFFARQGGYIDIRNEPYEAVREKISGLVKNGIPVIAFPEGTRSGGKQMNQFHSAVFHIAKETGCPLIPVGIAGNESIPDRNFRLHRGRILIRKFSAIPSSVQDELSAYRLKQHVRDFLIRACEESDQILENETK